MNGPDPGWRVDGWTWKAFRQLVVLRGFEEGEYMAPVEGILRRGRYEDGWPDGSRARFTSTAQTLCTSQAEAVERALTLAGFRRPLPASQTPWKMSHARIVDVLERFRGVDPMVLNARAIVARKGALSPRFTLLIEQVIPRLVGPWEELF